MCVEVSVNMCRDLQKFVQGYAIICRDIQGCPKDMQLCNALLVPSIVRLDREWCGTCCSQNQKIDTQLPNTLIHTKVSYVQ